MSLELPSSLGFLQITVKWPLSARATWGAKYWRALGRSITAGAKKSEGAPRGPGGEAEALAEDAEAGAVGVPLLPDDHEFAGLGVHRDALRGLAVAGGGGDGELRPPEGAVDVVALAEDAVAGGRGGEPDGDEFAGAGRREA